MQVIGIVVDANDDIAARWMAVRNRCMQSFPDIPAELPEEGLIHINGGGLRLGIWLMPDNRTAGMLETFLGYLVPEDGDALWTFAKHACEQAREQHGATFRQPHTAKAFVHAWLAWQDPPGSQLHQAIFKHILNPTSDKAQTFVNWFKQLFEL